MCLIFFTFRFILFQPYYKLLVWCYYYYTIIQMFFLKIITIVLINDAYHRQKAFRVCCQSVDKFSFRVLNSPIHIKNIKCYKFFSFFLISNNFNRLPLNQTTNLKQRETLKYTSRKKPTVKNSLIFFSIFFSCNYATPYRLFKICFCAFFFMSCNML